MEPDNTAVRTALWRALHMQVDAMPHIIEDDIGLRMIAPQEGWQRRPDMQYTQRLRASIVARGRFIEDLVIDQCNAGVSQYVLLGAGLDTFVQRRPDIAARMEVYEIDQPGTLEWKQQRLVEIGCSIPEYLHFVPVDFEMSSWWKELLKAGFDPGIPAFIACTGVSLYLTETAITDTLAQVAGLARGSKLAMTFYLPKELLDEQDKPMQEIAEKGAREAGTPIVSFYTPDDIIALANKACFNKMSLTSTKDMERSYFADRTDGLLPASGEVFLLATT